ncbi:MAG TPA: response regulator transcription factor [Burkholderiales bacterium]|nr:response regulator transcription factor [Burkholderiales bacterium]
MDVLVVDDHPMLHETLGAVVRSVLPGAVVHGEMDLAGGLSKARELQALDLVLLDLGLPGCTGIEALLRFRKALPRARVVVISANEDSAAVRAALDAGAAGYVPKTSPPRVIAEALRFIVEGGVYVPAEVLGTPAAPRRPIRLADLGITERQGDVLRLLVRGLTNGQIASALAISRNTVKQHAHAAYRALGVSSRTEAVVALARMGIPPE